MDKRLCLVCLRFEPGAAGWQARTKPQSYGGRPSVVCFCQCGVFVFVFRSVRYFNILWLGRNGIDWRDTSRKKLTWKYRRQQAHFDLTISASKNVFLMGGSPGLVVMGGDSCSKDCGFESQHRILYGHFSQLFAVNIVVFVRKDENKRKTGRGWPIFAKNVFLIENFMSASTLGR